MHTPNAIDYSVIRVVPFVERQEFINVGVIVFSRTLDFLDARIDLSLKRLKIFSDQTDIGPIRKQLQVLLKICHGEKQCGFFNNLSKSERFNWLVAPSSTVIQASPVHTGLTKDPQKTLNELYDIFVTV